MSKKNQNKKHRFKYAEPNTSSSALQSASVAGRPARVIGNIPSYAKTSSASSDRDFSYVAGDLRRITAFAIALVGLELLLWALLGHTAVGDLVYRLVKV